MGQLPHRFFWGGGMRRLRNRCSHIITKMSRVWVLRIWLKNNWLSKEAFKLTKMNYICEISSSTYHILICRLHILLNRFNLRKGVILSWNREIFLHAYINLITDLFSLQLFKYHKCLTTKTLQNILPNKLRRRTRLQQCLTLSVVTSMHSIFSVAPNIHFDFLECLTWAYESSYQYLAIVNLRL